MPRDVDDEPVGQRLAVGARAAAARGDRHTTEARIVQQARDPDEVVGVAREGDRLRRELVDRIVRRQHRPSA